LLLLLVFLVTEPAGFASFVLGFTHCTIYQIEFMLQQHSLCEIWDERQKRKAAICESF